MNFGQSIQRLWLPAWTECYCWAMLNCISWSVQHEEFFASVDLCYVQCQWYVSPGETHLSSLSHLSLSLLGVCLILFVCFPVAHFLPVSNTDTHTHTHTAQHSTVNTLSSHSVNIDTGFPLGNLSFLHTLKPLSCKEPGFKVTCTLIPAGMPDLPDHINHFISWLSVPLLISTQVMISRCLGSNPWLGFHPAPSINQSINQSMTF